MAGTATYIQPSISIGDINVTGESYDAVNIAPLPWSAPVFTEGPTVIPGSDGALLVEVENVGGKIENASLVDIDVNGDDLAPNNQWRNPPEGLSQNRTTTPKKQYFSDTVTVTITASSGGAFRYRVWPAT
ncbi:MAG: hypothetical protein AAFZ15_17325 [Bacteroidota bacterium]